MSCFRPLEARKDPVTGVVSFGSSTDGRSMELPCGKCIGCKLDRARAWSLRIGHEAQLYDNNLFVTLTYDSEHVPRSLSLEYRDFQLFMKRVRKRFKGVSVAPNGKRPLRFFVAGEYGGQTGRPHWHAVLFNLALRDQERLRNGTYRSGDLEDLWGNGGCVIGRVTPESAAYVAGYTLAKVHGQAAESYYEDVVDFSTGEVGRRRPEFCVMSRRPGIGAWWYERFRGDLFPRDRAVQGDKEFKVPRYYWDRFRLEADPVLVEELEQKRIDRAMESREESTPQRREEREYVMWARKELYGARGL